MKTALPVLLLFSIAVLTVYGVKRQLRKSELVENEVPVLAEVVSVNCWVRRESIRVRINGKERSTRIYTTDEECAELEKLDSVYVIQKGDILMMADDEMNDPRILEIISIIGLGIFGTFVVLRKTLKERNTTHNKS